MKSIFYFALFVLAIIFFSERFVNNTPQTYAYEGERYISVFGRTSCGYTRQMTKYLDSQGIAYHYFDIDNKQTSKYVHEKLQAAGFNTNSYYLPVIDINGKFSISPKPELVKMEYYQY